jgi:hypothetical protein
LTQTNTKDTHRGPWRVVAKANDYRTTDVVVGKTIVATNISGNDSSLIADAPDLLAEVKRLREENQRLRDMVLNPISHMSETYRDILHKQGVDEE